MNLPQVPIRTPVTDDNSIMTAPWVKWLTQLSNLSQAAAAMFGTLEVATATTDPSIFTFTKAPLVVFVSGLMQRPDIDYTVAGTQVTFTPEPATGSNVYAILSA